MTKSNSVVQLDLETEFATARAAVQRAKADRDAAKRKVDEFAAQLFTLSESAKDAAANDAHALAYLAGRAAPDGPATIRQRLDEAKTQLAILERAVNIATEHVKAARKKLDKRDIEAARPRHAEAVRRIADALVTLSLALESEESIRHELPGGALSLPPMSFAGVGLVGDISSNVSLWLQRAKGLGFIDDKFRAAEIGERRAAAVAAGKARLAQLRQAQPDKSDARAKIERGAKRIADYVAAAE